MDNKIIYIKLKEGCKPIEYFRMLLATQNPKNAKMRNNSELA